MLVASTPYRVSFFGGGTDHHEWYSENGGSVLSTTIDKYCHITCRYLPPYFEHLHRVVWSKIELAKHFEEIEHPVVKEVMRLWDVQRGIEIHHIGDLPARSGLGSSSSFAVGMLQALKALHGEKYEAKQLAKDAINLEQNILNEVGGIQDQIAVAYGGLNQIEIDRDGDFSVKKIHLTDQREAELFDNLFLVPTGIFRNSSGFASKTKNAIKSKHEVFQKMQSLVSSGIAVLMDEARPLDQFGELLNEGWKLKSSLDPQISSAGINEQYELARSFGAVGGKLLGAGGGGFFLFFVRKEDQPTFKRRFGRGLCVSFSMDKKGSSVRQINT